MPLNPNVLTDLIIKDKILPTLTDPVGVHSRMSLIFNKYILGRKIKATLPPVMLGPSLTPIPVPTPLPIPPASINIKQTPSSIKFNTCPNSSVLLNTFGKLGLVSVNIIVSGQTLDLGSFNGIMALGGFPGFSIPIISLPLGNPDRRITIHNQISIPFCMWLTNCFLTGIIPLVGTGGTVIGPSVSTVPLMSLNIT